MMRFHRHQVGRTGRWHSVRQRHEDVWDWCAHREELERYQLSRRHAGQSDRDQSNWKVQVAS